VQSLYDTTQHVAHVEGTACVWCIALFVWQQRSLYRTVLILRRDVLYVFDRSAILSVETDR